MKPEGRERGSARLQEEERSDEEEDVGGPDASQVWLQ